MSSQIDDKGFIRKVAFLAIISAFTVSITGCSSDEAEDNEMARKAIEERLAPIATVAVAGKSADDASAAPAAAKSGADIVASACAACHTTGVANAPKIGDNAAWQPRFDTGMDALMNSALNGKGAAMPARGGNPALTDDEIKAAVVHMLTESGIDADAPAAPAAAPEVPAEPAMPA
ncbi:c-type cytochrome, partial [Solemya velum gill symbiont]